MDRERVGAACGFLAPTVALGAIFLATLLATPETFTWRGRALSHMGELGAETFWVFNGGLVLAGLLGLPFGWLLWRDARNGLERVGVAILAVCVVGLVGVGVFFLEHTEWYLSVDLHFPAAAAVFLGAPIAKWVYAAGLRRAGDTRAAVLTAGLGLVHPVNWIAWAVVLQVTADPMAWFAVAEMVAAIAFGLWIAILAVPRLGLSATAQPDTTQRLS